MEIIVSSSQKKAEDELLIRDLALFVLESEEANKNTEISVSLVDEAKIKDLNKRFRNIDKETDVLSFEGSFLGDFLGDVVICPAQASKKALQVEMDFDDYFALLVVHSILHLLGYSHESNEHAKVMSNREKQLLEDFNRKNKDT